MREDEGSLVAPGTKRCDMELFKVTERNVVAPKTKMCDQELRR